MKITFISSMNIDLYEQYGNVFLSEFEKYSGDDVNLINVFEGEVPEILIDNKKAITIPLKSDEHQKFKKYFGRLWEANGLRIIYQKKTNNEQTFNLDWDYRFNAMKFSFKIFSIFLALEHKRMGDNFVWIDADMRCLKHFNADGINKFMPDEDQIMSYLGRKNHYSECGFLGFNNNYEQTSKYLNRVKDIYTTGEIFSLDEWHDSWIWDHVRKEFENKGSNFKNISTNPNADHPFVNSGLQEFFDHLKGPERKKMGKSFNHDYVK